VCRLFGWAAQHQTSAGELLGPDVARLQALSEIHKDGWGGAWHGPSGLELYREDGPAYASAVFSETITDREGQTGLLHLRWATGTPRCLENTHPFVRDGFAFIHNGSLPIGPQLESLIDPDVLSSVEGSTDSERYFLAVLTERRKGTSVPEAFRRVINSIGDLPWPSLNAMWAEPDWLFAICAYQPEFRSADLDENYYRLQYVAARGVTMAWSRQVRSSDCEELPNRTILAARASTGEYELIRI
jgi:predicted glutamine amidotransferase